MMLRFRLMYELIQFREERLMMMFMTKLRLKKTDQFLHGGVGEDPVEGGEGEGGEQADVDLVA